MSRVDSILEQIKQLPPEQREQLFWYIDDKYGDDNPNRPIRLTKRDWAFIEERNAAYEANPDELYTWEEVVEHIKREKQ